MMVAKILTTGMILVFLDWLFAVEKYEKEKDEVKRDILWERCEKKANVMIKYGIFLLCACVFGIWFL